ncbi:olfactory receptor 2AT4-like [Protopterus annectens]|uniref:olfactory receptor 2AT4-like n=1 Tax=Protopterus annectens TaxID=7888 RepID=UPI001CF959CD|nr:olfactory receptor 2AT4-like [Protopterus annectens]
MTEFILAGFQYTYVIQMILFPLFLFIYLTILLGNCVILAAVIKNEKLQKPMYFFVCNLAILDILLTSVTLPRILFQFLTGVNVISFAACFAQLCILHSLLLTEAFILVVMAYDRYLAICNPLHYTMIMTNKVNTLFVVIAWVTAIFLIVPPVLLTAQLPFCGPNKIPSFFCEHVFVIRLAKTDAPSSYDSGLFIGIIISLLPFLLVVFSYIKILISALKVSSQDGIQKGLSTCTSHLLVVLIYYTTSGISTVSYKVENMPDTVRVVCSLSFIILTPIANPMIYTLRNRDMKLTIAKIARLGKSTPGER